MTTTPRIEASVALGEAVELLRRVQRHLPHETRTPNPASTFMAAWEGECAACQLGHEIALFVAQVSSRVRIRKPKGTS